MTVTRHEVWTVRWEWFNIPPKVCLKFLGLIGDESWSTCCQSSWVFLLLQNNCLIWLLTRMIVRSQENTGWDFTSRINLFELLCDWWFCFPFGSEMQYPRFVSRNIFSYFFGTFEEAGENSEGVPIGGLLSIAISFFDILSAELNCRFNFDTLKIAL